MRYHLFPNSIRKIVKTTKGFSRKLAVKSQSSTNVAHLYITMFFLKKRNVVATVLAIGKKIKPHLCGKLALFKTP